MPALTMRALFKNPKAALAYVVMTLLGVVLFVGTEQSPGSLQHTMETFKSDERAARKFGDAIATESQPADDEQIGRSRASQRDAANEDVIIEFADDEELIDTAQGFDASPTDGVEGFSADTDGERPFLSDQDREAPEDEREDDWGA